MSHVIVTADLHLDAGRWGKVNPLTGANSAWESASAVWQEICTHAVDSGAEALLFAGDAFLNANPTPEAQERFADGLRLVARAGIRVVLIPGNHEFLGLPGGHRHPLWRYGDIDGVHISHSPELVVLDSGLQVATLPWPRKSLIVSAEDISGCSPAEIDAMIAGRLVEALDDLAAQIDPEAPSVLLAHATVGEATVGSSRRGSEMTVASIFSEPVLPVDLLADGPWSHVALGHIHKRQHIAPTRSGGAISYVGSPERIDWSEEDQPKGYSVLEYGFGAAVHEQFVPSSARRLVTLEVTGEPETLEDLTGALVRLRLEELHDDVRAWRRAVSAAGGTVVGVITPMVVPGAREALSADGIEEIGPLEGLERWLAGQDLDDDVRDEVRRIAQQLTEEHP